MLINSSTNNILVVTGYQHELVKSTLVKQCNLSVSNKRVQFVHNPQFETGMGSSVATGVSNSKDADAVLVCLADMPGINVDIVNALHSAWQSQSQFEAYLPEYRGRTGNPALLSSTLFSKLLTLNADSGARQIIKEHPVNVLNVPVHTDAIFKDVDVQSDLL